jgi:hypothetical protein
MGMSLPFVTVSPALTLEEAAQLLGPGEFTLHTRGGRDRILAFRTLRVPDSALIGPRLPCGAFAPGACAAGVLCDVCRGLLFPDDAA